MPAAATVVKTQQDSHASRTQQTRAHARFLSKPAAVYCELFKSSADKGCFELGDENTSLPVVEAVKLALTHSLSVEGGVPAKDITFRVKVQEGGLAANRGDWSDMLSNDLGSWHCIMHQYFPGGYTFKSMPNPDVAVAGPMKLLASTAASEDVYMVQLCLVLPLHPIAPKNSTPDTADNKPSGTDSEQPSHYPVRLVTSTRCKQLQTSVLSNRHSNMAARCSAGKCSCSTEQFLIFQGPLPADLHHGQAVFLLRSTNDSVTKRYKELGRYHQLGFNASGDKNSVLMSKEFGSNGRPRFSASLEEEDGLIVEQIRQPASSGYMLLHVCCSKMAAADVQGLSSYCRAAKRKRKDAQDQAAPTRSGTPVPSFTTAQAAAAVAAGALGFKPQQAGVRTTGMTSTVPESTAAVVPTGNASVAAAIQQKCLAVAHLGSAAVAAGYAAMQRAAAAQSAAGSGDNATKAAGVPRRVVTPTFGKAQVVVAGQESAPSTAAEWEEVEALTAADALLSIKGPSPDDNTTVGNDEAVPMAAVPLETAASRPAVQGELGAMLESFMASLAAEAGTPKNVSGAAVQGVSSWWDQQLAAGSGAPTPAQSQPQPVDSSRGSKKRRKEQHTAGHAGGTMTRSAQQANRLARECTPTAGGTSSAMVEQHTPNLEAKTSSEATVSAGAPTKSSLRQPNSLAALGEASCSPADPAQAAADAQGVSTADTAITGINEERAVPTAANPVTFVQRLQQRGRAITSALPGIAPKAASTQREFLLLQQPGTMLQPMVANGICPVQVPSPSLSSQPDMDDPTPASLPLSPLVQFTSANALGHVAGCDAQQAEQLQPWQLQRSLVQQLVSMQLDAVATSLHGAQSAGDSQDTEPLPFASVRPLSIVVATLCIGAAVSPIITRLLDHVPDLPLTSSADGAGGSDPEGIQQSSVAVQGGPAVALGHGGNVTVLCVPPVPREVQLRGGCVYLLDAESTHAALQAAAKCTARDVHSALVGLPGRCKLGDLPKCVAWHALRTELQLQCEQLVRTVEQQLFADAQFSR